MNKKDVNEVKKQFKKDNCCLTRICSCYVDHEKNKVTKLKTAFLSLPEEEEFKYFDLFKKSLAGAIGKQLVEYDLRQDDNRLALKDFFLRLKISRLEDEELVEKFYDQVIAHFYYAENYYIVLVHGVYDVPGKATSGEEMFDASDEVYEHLLCCICPVKRSKPGLTYDETRNQIKERERDWVVESPLTSILYPSFTDRAADLDRIVLYSKNPNKQLLEFFPEEDNSPAIQKEKFIEIMEGCIAKEHRYDVVNGTYEAIHDLIEENKDNPDPVVFHKKDILELLKKNGAEEREIKAYEEHIKEFHILASNVSEKMFTVQVPDIQIKVNPDRTDLIKKKFIDGKEFLMIDISNNIEMNGIEV